MADEKARILAVDDDPRLLESLRELLSLEGYEVSIVDDSRKAIQQLQTGRFDILLLDMKMPHVDGRQIMQFVADKQIPTDVIVISGESSFNSAVDAMRLGAHDFLTKPYVPNQLLKRLENTLAHRRLRKHNLEIKNRLEHSEKLYRFLVNTSPDFIYILDQKGNFVFVNKRVQDLLGHAPKELLGKHYTTIVCDQDREDAKYAFNERRTGERATRNFELRLCTKGLENIKKSFSHRILNIELYATGLYTGKENDRHRLGTYGVARDVSEKKRAEAVIHYQAYHDLLTGLPNRALFKDRLKMSLAQANRNEYKTAIMFIDLDRFKIVNDTLGHKVGDQLLRAAARSMQRCLRAEDTLARLGGDEFVVLLSKIKHPQDAAQVARKILDALEQPFILDERELLISASIGISVYPDDADEEEELIKNADVAMYSVKHDGKGNFAFYVKSMDANFSEHLEFEMRLRRALTEDEFCIYYQPQFDLYNQRIIGMEALLRWRHPELGLVLPGAFIPLAEEIGLITQITRWLIRAAAKQIHQWLEAGIAPPHLAINFSALDLKHSDIVEQILHPLREQKVPPERFAVEITENVIVKDIDSVAQRLSSLAHHGIDIAIDDFGTGYSSLGYLHQLPIKTLKIDRSFVFDIHPERKERTVIDAIIAMGQSLDLKLVAEGVETQAQRDWLLQRNCRVMQGNLFSAPLPAEEAGKLLALTRNDSPEQTPILSK